VSRHGRRRRKEFQPLAPGSFELANRAAPPADPDLDFDDSWREQLLVRTWDRLNQSHPLFHDVLRFRVQHPKIESADMADQLGCRLGRPFTAAGVRQTLHRAREKFADLLLDEVAHTLDNPTVERLQEELADLKLLDYCSSALKSRGHGRLEH